MFINTQFAKDEGKYVEERKLRVILTSPPGSPTLSPIKGDLKQGKVHEASILDGQVFGGVETLPQHNMVRETFIFSKCWILSYSLPCSHFLIISPSLVLTCFGIYQVTEDAKFGVVNSVESKPSKETELSPAKHVELKLKKEEELKQAKDVGLKLPKYEELEAIKDVDLKSTNAVHVESAKDVELKPAGVVELKPSEDLLLKLAKDVEVDKAQVVEDLKLAKDVEEMKSKLLEL